MYMIYYVLFNDTLHFTFSEWGREKKIITFTTKWTIVVGSRGRRQHTSGHIISLYLIIVAAVVVVDSFTNV